MPEISNNPMANAGSYLAEGLRRPADDQSMQRQDAVGASRDASGVPNTTVAGASGAANPSPTQRVSQVSVSPEARQRLAAESSGQGVTPTETTGSGGLQRRINDLLGESSAGPAANTGVPTDVSGGRSVAGTAPEAAVAERTSQRATDERPGGPTVAERIQEQRDAASQQPARDTNNDVTGNPQRIQRSQ